MFSFNKKTAVLLSILFLAQQFAVALPTESALRRDYVRFGRDKRVEQQAKADNEPVAAAAYKRLADFNKKTKGTWDVRLNRNAGTPRSLVGGRNISVGKGESGALNFIGQYKDFLGVDKKQLKLKLSRQSAIGYHYYFDQYYKNLQVETAYVKVHTDKTGQLINYQSTFIKDINIGTTPSKSPGQIASIAAADAAGTAMSAAELIIYPRAGAPVLAWRVSVQGGANEPGKWIYYIADSDGAILNRVSRLMYAFNVESFLAELNPIYPGYNGYGISDTSRPQLPLADLQIYYSQPPASGTTIVPMYEFTDSNGMVNIDRQPNTRAGRIWTAFSGNFFTVTNQRNNPSNTNTISGYYLEKGVNASSVIENPTFTWAEFVPTGSYQTYSSCGVTYNWPFISSPQIANMHVGAMDFSGVITSKIFLQINSCMTPPCQVSPPPLPSGKIMGKYIGKPGNTFLGPLIPNLSNTHTLTTFINPFNSPGTFGEIIGAPNKIDKMSRLCGDSRLATNYDQNHTHITGSSGVNEAEANAYYNLNKMRAFFQGLNTAGGGYINLNNHLPVIVNAYGVPYSGFGGMPNAFFDVDQKVLMFGEGFWVSSQFKNFALESAIVRHEYVHAAMDNIWPIFYFGEGAAIAEGLSDYFALSSMCSVTSTACALNNLGEYVSFPGAGGEGMVRQLNITDDDSYFDPYRWEENFYTNPHKNGLVVSRLLWYLRTVSTTYFGALTDQIVWDSLMFFPDSMVELGDALYLSAAANGVPSAGLTTLRNQLLNRFPYSIISNGDIYEPNNSPVSAADIDILSLKSGQLTATINPVSDQDYFSVALPPGQFQARLYMQQVPAVWPDAYYPLSIVLLDAELGTVIDLTDPVGMTGGNGIQTAPNPYVEINYNVPPRVLGTGTLQDPYRIGASARYIIGVYKPVEGLYPSPVAADSGTYTLTFTMGGGSNLGAVITNNPLHDFSDGTVIGFKAPYSDSRPVANANAIPMILEDWAPNHMEGFAYARLLDENLNPIPGADTNTGTYLQLGSPDPAFDPSVSQGQVINGSVEFVGDFNNHPNNYDVVYLQVFGKLRSNLTAKLPTAPAYRPGYGIVSLGISNPIVKNAAPGSQDIDITSPIFNPATGGYARILVSPKASGNMTVYVYTVDGILVRKLFSGAVNPAGGQLLKWDGKNDNGSIVASGVYLLRVEGGGIKRNVQKMVVVK